MQSSINLLLIGWLGVLAGYFSWLANPAYFIAIISKNTKTTIIFSSLALVFSLSFLTKEKLVVSEAPTYEAIVAYGPGYFLWVLAFFTLLLGEMLEAYKKNNKFTLVSILSVNIILALIYTIYYYKGESSIYHLFSEREKHFIELCSKVDEKHYKPVQDIKGVFIDYIPGNYFRDISGQKHGAFGGSLVSYVRNGYYEFEERKPYSDRETKLPFVRISSKSPNERIPVENLESNYSATSINLASELPKALGITSHKVLIKHIESDEVYAETSFAHIKNDLRICAPTNSDSYSVPNFVFSALNLRKEP